MEATSYIIAYLVAGLLLACGFLINQTAKPARPVLAALLITIIWPIFALAAPEAFFKADPKSKEESDPLSVSLCNLLEDQARQLDPLLVEKIRSTAEGGERSVAYFGAPGNLAEVLDAFWNDDIPPSVFYDLRAARAALKEGRGLHSGALFSRREPDWFVGFSNEFLKCIAKADGRMRGRILDAIGKISAAPVEVVGDTVKPLTANLSGMWRYRIGDDRLVYLPDLRPRESRCFTLDRAGMSTATFLASDHND